MIMNAQYSRVGRTYPKMDSTLISGKPNRDCNSFSITEENRTVQTQTDSTVSRFLIK